MAEQPNSVNRNLLIKLTLSNWEFYQNLRPKIVSWYTWTRQNWQSNPRNKYYWRWGWGIENKPFRSFSLTVILFLPSDFPVCATTLLRGGGLIHFQQPSSSWEKLQISIKKKNVQFKLTRSEIKPFRKLSDQIFPHYLLFWTHVNLCSLMSG